MNVNLFGSRPSQESVIPLKISLIYALVGGLWILFSDKLISSLFTDPETILGAGIAKGWFFIVATAVLLYMLIRRNLIRVHLKEETIKESESKYQTIFENTGTATVILEDDMTISLANSEFERISGYSKDQVELKKKWSEFITENQVERVKEYHRLRRVEPSRVPTHYEIQLVDSSGKIKDSYMTVALIPESKQSVASILDITDRRSAEEALKESQRALAALMSNLPGMVYRCRNDRKWTMEFVSEGCVDLTGYQPSDLVGNKQVAYNDLIDPDDREWLWNDAQKALESQKPFRMEYQIMTASGEKKWVWEQGQGVFSDGGDLTALEGFIADITVLKRAEERAKLQQQQLIQADKMATLGILVSGVAHEINNPNNYIMLNAKIIKRTWNDIAPILKQYYEANGDFALAGMPYTRAHEKIGALIAGLTDGSNRIQKIVESLKNYAREDLGDLNQAVQIDLVVEAALVILNNLIKKSTNHFSVNYGKNLPKIRGNPQQLEQVIINLITNSCQALQEKKQEISVSTSYNDHSNCVAIEVCDEGAGIPQENLKHIMDPFFTTKRNSGGTGLGLSISQRIVKDHGGELVVSSEKGKGTGIKVSLPIKERNQK